jgi:hypothetical protein
MTLVSLVKRRYTYLLSKTIIDLSEKEKEGCCRAI